MLHRLALVALTLTAGCANYDFTKARTIDGKLDTKKLIADLKASGEESLSDGIWLPLIWCDIATFGPSRPGKPTGYEFSRWTGVGPLFVNGSYENVLIDANGATVESDDRVWIGWTLLLNDREGRIETIAGTRLETTWRALFLFGYDDHVFYASRR